MSPETVRVAVTQCEPEWMSLSKSVAKTCKLINEAAENGAQLVTFPECFIPGYPAWIWARPVDFERSVTYIKNSLKVNSNEMSEICRCAANNNITVALGFSENDGNSLYISQCLIGADGKIKMHRRKLKATHMERTVFGDSSGKSLLNVVSTPIGRVGSLACWEHIQPLLKYHTMLQREEIHVAAWPPVAEHEGGPDFWSMSRDGCHNLSQTYAIESQTFVLHTTAVISAKGVEIHDTSSAPILCTPGGGSSAIFGPDGRRISKVLGPTEEGIIYGDLNLDDVLRAKSFADACGHYSRPDVLWLGVDTREKRHMQGHDGKLYHELSECREDVSVEIQM